MAGADTKIIDPLNDDASKRFELELRKNQVINDCRTATATLEVLRDQKLAEIQAEIEKIDARIWKSIDKNRDSLIDRGKRSFATVVAAFKLSTNEPKTVVKDAKGIMEVAREFGVVRQVSKAKYVWVFNQDKFFEWLRKHPEMRSHFNNYLEDTEKSESLRLVPNSGYTVYYDSKRISPPSVSIKTS